MTKKDAYSVIKKQLESGPKTSKELKEACEKRGIPSSTFYYHMKQLVDKLKEVEKIRVENAQGLPVEKYSLVEEKVFFWEKSSGIKGFRVGDVEVEVPPNRRVLELAAWMRHEPRGWASDNFEVKAARLYLQHSGYLVPDIVMAPEDSDAYAFKWPNEELDELDLEELRRLNLYKCPSSRFFDLKLVYDAIVANSNKEAISKGPVCVGAHSNKLGEDGDWFEGTIRYHCYSMIHFVPFADACLAQGIFDYYKIDKIKSMFDAIIYYQTPNGGFLGFNDATHWDPVTIGAPVLLRAA